MYAKLGFQIIFSLPSKSINNKYFLYFSILNEMKTGFISFLFLFFTADFFAQGEDCNSATQINSVLNYCSGNAFFTNTASTPGSYALPSCWSANATEDVWFSYTALGTDVLVSVSGMGGGGTMAQPRIALYEGPCGGNLTELNCANGSAGFGTTQLYEGALIPGNTYYIRVATPPASEGTFELCINSYTPSTNPGADCGGASFLCNQNPVSVATLAGGGNNNDEPEPGTCLDMPGPDESNSSWFYWTCGISGPLTFDITPVNPTDDIDFVFYELNSSNPCGSRTPIRCCSSSCLNSTGSTGMSLSETDLTEMPGCQAGYNAYIQSINMVAGTSYALLVNNFSANTGFTLTFNSNNPNGGLFAGPSPQITSSSLNICEGDSVFFDGLASQNCSVLNWNFTQNAMPSGAVGSGPHLVDYPTAGNYTAILNGVDVNGCQSLDFVNINVNPSIQLNINPTNTICSGNAFIENLSTIPSGANFIYTTNTNSNVIGASNGNGPIINQVLINNTQINQNVTYTVNASLNGCTDVGSCVVTITPLDEPVFNQMGPFCLGLIPAPVLPNQSLMGITGFWNTPTVNTQQEGTTLYEFTPDPGQCADSASMSILVSLNPGVTFSADNLISCAPLVGTLSTSSIAGATYAWLINGQQVGDTPSFNYDLSNPGCYDVELVVDVSGCSSTSLSSDYLCAVEDPIASFSFIPNQFSASAENVQFYNSTLGNNTYSWNFGDGSTSTQEQVNHQYTSTYQGYFVTLTVTSELGCIDSVTQFIGYEEQIVFYVPNTFTPDQDEHNQVWRPIFTSGFDAFDFHLMVYDRWGELIWESLDPLTGWDGTFGKVIDVQQGTYNWVLEFQLKNNDDKKSYTGTVNVIR